MVEINLDSSSDYEAVSYDLMDIANSISQFAPCNMEVKPTYHAVSYKLSVMDNFGNYQELLVFNVNKKD